MRCFHSGYSAGSSESGTPVDGTLPHCLKLILFSCKLYQEGEPFGAVFQLAAFDMGLCNGDYVSLSSLSGPNI